MDQEHAAQGKDILVARLHRRGRQNCIDGFQGKIHANWTEKEKAEYNVRFLIGTVDAMGAGITLHAADGIGTKNDRLPSLRRQHKDRAVKARNDSDLSIGSRKPEGSFVLSFTSSNYLSMRMSKDVIHIPDTRRDKNLVKPTATIRNSPFA